MNISCIFGSHNWNGCICSKCSKTRDEGHDWTKDCEKCAKCNKTRIGAHVWNGCTCPKCGKTRDEGHDWTKDCEKCKLCGTTRSNAHSWTGCKCTKCGKTRAEDHDWSKNCEKCESCGITRSDAHAWAGCDCTRCEATRHQWEKGKCKVCGTREKASVLMDPAGIVTDGRGLGVKVNGVTHRYNAREAMNMLYNLASQLNEDGGVCNPPAKLLTLQGPVQVESEDAAAVIMIVGQLAKSEILEAIAGCM